MEAPSGRPQPGAAVVLPRVVQRPGGTPGCAHLKPSACGFSPQLRFETSPAAYWQEEVAKALPDMSVAERPVHLETGQTEDLTGWGEQWRRKQAEAQEKTGCNGGKKPPAGAASPESSGGG